MRIEITSYHGLRAFETVGEQQYQRKDGTHTTLTRWRSHCVICGAPFDVLTPQSVTKREQSNSFEIVTCPAHRLTPSEMGRIRRAGHGQRAARFAEIVKAKLAAKSAVTA